MEIIPISVLRDNYIWLLINPNNGQAICIDPGDAQPVIDYLTEHQLQLCAILITHHHFDHTSGIKKLAQLGQIQVYGPKHDNISGLTQPLVEGDIVDLQPLNMQLKVLEIPGHTRGHIAYYGHGLLFSGDTLFSAGCGRLFEGTARQLYTSLQKLAHLDDNSQIYCGHEYTEQNLHFAATVEPQNNDIQVCLKEARLKRQQNLPTLPVCLMSEKRINPFLRCQKDSVIQSVQHHWSLRDTDPVTIFAHLRAWKDRWCIGANLK